MKIEKGRPGYIRFRKTKYLLWAVIEFAVVIALVVIGTEWFPHELAHCSSSCRMSSGCKDAC